MKVNWMSWQMGADRTTLWVRADEAQATIDELESSKLKELLAASITVAKLRQQLLERDLKIDAQSETINILRDKLDRAYSNGFPMFRPHA